MFWKTDLNPESWILNQFFVCWKPAWIHLAESFLYAGTTWILNPESFFVSWKPVLNQLSESIRVLEKRPESWILNPESIFCKLETCLNHLAESFFVSWNYLNPESWINFCKLELPESIVTWNYLNPESELRHFANTLSRLLFVALLFFVCS